FFQAIDDLKRRTAELSQTKDRMEQDLKLARTLQQSILPAQYPRIPRKQITGGLALSFSHFYRSAAYLGGDFFSILPMGSSKVGIFICDVVGHGVSSALITSMIRTMIDTIAPGTENPGRMLELMNIQLYNLLKNHTDNFFASAGYLFMDTRKEELSYADAGHPAPFLIIPETGEVGKLEIPEGISGPPLGIIDASQYGTFQRDLNEGERFFLFTDGAYEVFGEDGSMFGKERMAGLLRRHADQDAEQMISDVVESITEFSSRKYLEDDVCMITVDTRRISSEG
ncbi:MAG: serine/threonine-protein phosphatase, partial [Spirochaetales bacterium]|nr:serine/threonine-protein phosphatase [Spirochaetales bacterium]MCF7939422.1 serine/threonine-protein phosphatase [Spirochaetales bacterium]